MVRCPKERSLAQLWDYDSYSGKGHKPCLIAVAATTGLLATGKAKITMNDQTLPTSVFVAFCCLRGNHIFAAMIGGGGDR